MTGATRLARRLLTVGRIGANPVEAGARAARGATAAVRGRALSTAAPHEIFGLCAPPLVDPETLRSRWREEVLGLFDTPSACPDDDRLRWREQCLAIATGGAPLEAPPPRSHELDSYCS
jgi:hypothetical protein